MARLSDLGSGGGGLALARWLWRDYFRRWRWVLAAAVLLMAVEGGALGLISYMVRPMFDRIFIGGDMAAVWWIGGLILAIFAARALAGFGQRVLMSLSGLGATAALQQDLVRHMMRLDSLFFQDNPPGALIERVRGDTQALQTAWTTVVPALGRDLVSLLSLLGVALSIDWRWTLIALVAAPLLVLPVLALQRIIHATSRRARIAAARIATRLDEIFHGINPIKLNALEAREEERFAAATRDFVKSSVASEAGRAAVPAMMDLLAGIGFFAVLVYGGGQVVAGEKTFGEFMSFFTALALVFEPMRRLGSVSGTWQVAVASMERLRAIFDARPTILPPARPVPPPARPEAADVVLEDVHFAYGDQPVLQGLSLTARAGEMTALVGPSGAGKSTVFNVLTRLVEPQRGQVTIGGVPVGQMALGDLRGLFSVVAQDALLFDDSLRDNILLGRQDAGARLEQACEIAHVADFAARLPEGLDSPAGPRGANLSGGQRQRVAIARAVLRDAPILLLDEPTSALDARSEQLVQQALAQLSQKRTTLVIAHRLATILHADRIVVMDRGRVVDEGTHDELLARDGIYAGLYRLQFEGGGSS